jgi:hypothetical protein
MGCIITKCSNSNESINNVFYECKYDNKKCEKCGFELGVEIKKEKDNDIYIVEKYDHCCLCKKKYISYKNYHMNSSCVNYKNSSDNHKNCSLQQYFHCCECHQIFIKQKIFVNTISYSISNNNSITEKTTHNYEHCYKCHKSYLKSEFVDEIRKINNNDNYYFLAIIILICSIIIKI